MYTSWEKSLREEKQKRHHPKTPSFSSILLDEIFNSIDGNQENPIEVKHFKNQPTRKPKNDLNYVKIKEVEEMASMKRACLMEKLMEKKINEKVSSIRKISSLPEFENLRSLPDNDPMFFSTSSSSSSESNSGALSSSDAELFYTTTKSRNITSCFSSKSSSKHINVPANFPPRPRRNNHQDPSNYKQSECYMFDDFYNSNQYIKGDGSEESLMKSKSRALKMYNNLKKVKQPISPGGRLTSFITSLFASGNVKKEKEQGKYGKKGGRPSSTNASTCSSTSSFARSCMSKSVPNSKGKFDDFGARKTVHFYPVNIIADEDSHSYGHKSMNGEEFDGFKKQPRSYQNLETLKSHVIERNENIDHEGRRDVFLKGWKNQEKDEDFDDEDVDGFSDCSSDLFEIDHLEVFGNTRFCEELPVYETTRLDRNRVIASGLKV